MDALTYEQMKGAPHDARRRALTVNSEEISHGLRGLRRFQSVKSAQSVAQSPFLIRSLSDLDTASINDLGNGGSKSPCRERRRNRESRRTITAPIVKRTETSKDRSW